MISAPVWSLMMPVAPGLGSQQWGRGTITLARVASIPVPVRALVFPFPSGHSQSAVD